MHAKQQCKLNMGDIKPIWITVDGGDLFDGHQGHWADCFFSNATRAIIRQALDEGSIKSDTFSIREMTQEEVHRYPEIKGFCEELIRRYGDY